jgi:hypothetical protein
MRLSAARTLSPRPWARPPAGSPSPARSRPRGLVWALLLLAAPLAGCDERPRVPLRDASVVRDGGSRRDAGRLDAGPADGAAPDAGPPAEDAGPDAGPIIVGPGMRFDAAVPRDAAPPLVLPDAGALPDSGPRSCLDPVTGEPDPCLCPPLAFLCSGDPSACPLGTACVDTGCGVSYCLAAGSLCDSDLDCAPGARCARVYERFHCVRTDPGCVDSRDCPVGHACEPDGEGGRACVDRRIPCDVGIGCPRGFFCVLDESLTPYCERGYSRCDRDGACPGARCVDFLGDGLRQCAFPSRACPSPERCPAGQVCGISVTDYAMECGSHGPCRTAADCPSGTECLDLWGDGTPTCEPLGASCAAGSCPPRQLCASPAEGGPPRCIDGA